MFKRTRILVPALLLATAAPLYAQARIDTTARGLIFNFANADLGQVLQALADAGHLPIIFSNIPTNKKISLPSTPFAPDRILDLIRALSSDPTNNLKISGDTANSALITISGPAQVSAPTAQQILQQQLAATELHLHVYRLKHVDATQLAPEIQNLFTGQGNIPGQTAVGGGVNLNNLGGIGAALGGLGGGNNGGGGRGARGGAAGGGNNFGGAAGAGGAGNAGAGGGRAGGANNALGQILGGAGGGGGNAAALGAALGASAQLIRIIPDETTNSLLIRASDADWDLIRGVIEGVDLRPLQVFIEVAIVELSKTNDLNVGITAAGNNVPKSTGGTNVFGRDTSSTGVSDFILQLTKGGGTVNFNVALNALRSMGDVRISSLPVIIAENNKQAVLNVGQQRPFVEATTTTTGVGLGTSSVIQYLSVGTTLTITPTINPDGYVNLQVTQTDDNATNDVQFSAPVLDQRSAQTQIFIHDGQTTVLGGLAAHTITHTTSGIPFLSEIPWIGGLFRNTQNGTEDDELFLFLTPHVISTDGDMDRLRHAVQNGEGMLKETNIGPFFTPLADTMAVQVPLPGAMKKPPTAADSAAAKKKPPTDSVPSTTGRPPVAFVLHKPEVVG